MWLVVCATVHVHLIVSWHLVVSFEQYPCFVRWAYRHHCEPWGWQSGHKESAAVLLLSLFHTLTNIKHMYTVRKYTMAWLIGLKGCCLFLVVSFGLGCYIWDSSVFTDLTVAALFKRPWMTTPTHTASTDGQCVLSIVWLFGSSSHSLCDCAINMLEFYNPTFFFFFFTKILLTRAVRSIWGS